MIIQKVNTFRGFKDYINNISDGNLISHLRALEQAGFIIIEKTIKNNKYRTLYKLSVTGDKKFKEMLEGMVIMANEAYNI
jgi:DNA-binding HxlR family transcriptional regulator